MIKKLAVDEEINGVMIKFFPSVGIPDEIIVCKNDQDAQDAMLFLQSSELVEEAHVVKGKVNWQPAL